LPRGFAEEDEDAAVGEDALCIVSEVLGEDRARVDNAIARGRPDVGLVGNRRYISGSSWARVRCVLLDNDDFLFGRSLAASRSLSRQETQYRRQR